ncbi:splicing factor 3A subunit 1-like [Clavelina lepadiformis]|uniref:Splicing factor 3A subunit 1 n=1 Tax=Clavelina lepadiformis TaxID=159417 RepID=A0ABP0FKY7_CLALP
MAPTVQQNDDIRVSGDAPEPAPEETQSSKPIIGIIYPPPEVRNIVDKTASFVGRNGPEFEARIRQNEINNAKFNFLNSNDPYHAYYRHKVKEFMDGKAKEPSVPKPTAPTVKASVAVVQEQFVPKDPPSSFEYIADPPSISAYDIDVVRLTAQFVAKNGRSFLTQLTQREAKNFQFDFLRPQHSLFQYFTKLVDQYTKILLPPKNVLERLKAEAKDPKLILDDVKYRVAWTKHEERIKQREQAAIEKERAMYAQIDWHDFVVVETVDFMIDERGNFPKPVTVEELGSRLLHQERIEKFGEENLHNNGSDSDKEESHETGEQLQLVDMEESSDEDEEDIPPPAPRPKVQPAPPIQPPRPPSMEEMIIRKDYNPKYKHGVMPEKEVGGDNWMVSPITGERVPATKIQEHMRYGLLDPNWKEQKKRQMAEKQQEEEVFAAGSDIEASLKGLAERRTDIFGVEETGIGKKVGEEEIPPEEKVAWDGHSSSANLTQKQAKANVSIEEQLQHIQKTQGMLVDHELEKIGPKPTDDKPSEPAPVPKPVSISSTEAVALQPAPNPAVQIQQQPTVLTPVVMRPVIPVQRPNPQVLVVQQQMHVVPPPQPQLIAVQQPRMMMPHMVQPQMIRQIQPMPHMQQIPQQGIPQVMDGPPAAKRARTEGDLLSAELFLQQHNGPVTFRVQCPSAPDKSEWNLQGQTLTFTLPLTDEVSVIKAKIHEATGMPAGKQKLQMDGLFIKDSNSLAFYNMASGALVSLQVKERGGRKK